MPRKRQRTENEIRKLIDLDKETIRIIAKDAIDKDLYGFKQNAERILREYAKRIEARSNH